MPTVTSGAMTWGADSPTGPGTEPPRPSLATELVGTCGATGGATGSMTAPRDAVEVSSAATFEVLGLVVTSVD